MNSGLMTKIRNKLWLTIILALLAASTVRLQANATHPAPEIYFPVKTTQWLLQAIDHNNLLIPGFHAINLPDAVSILKDKLLQTSGVQVQEAGSPDGDNRNSDSETITESGEFPTLDNLWQQYLGASLKVKILLAILIYLVLSVIALFLGILINRYFKTKQRDFEKDLRSEYQGQLASFLFDDSVDRIEVRGINRKVNRQIFIDELRDLHNNLHGEVADKLKDLYFNLSLHKDSLRKVYSGRWDHKAKGFAELAQMDVKDANTKIESYVNSKNPILRMQAQVAMVKLSDENPLGFLDKLKPELSYWEQVNIYDTLVYHQINIDSFEKWLTHENTSVLIFALRMIGLFKHVQSGEKVRELLFDPRPEVALTAVQSLKKLELAEYANDLKILYQSETLKLKNILETQRKSKNDQDIKSLDDLIPRKIRFEIVQTLQPIVSADDIPFLEQIMQDEESSFKLRILAIEVLLGLKPEGEARVNQILGTAPELLKKMIINVKQNQES